MFLHHLPVCSVSIEGPFEYYLRLQLIFHFIFRAKEGRIKTNERK